MHILPVLDVMNGQVVRGVAGRRREYRPIVSQIATSARPLDVARAFRARFDLDELYLADLDAIAGADPAQALYADLRRDGFRLWIDAGMRTIEQVRLLAEAGVERIIVGLETIAGPEVLAQACADFGERIVFSLDLKEGAPLGATDAWETSDPYGIAGTAFALGVRRLIVLDLTRVGIAGGTGTEDLCGRLTKAYLDCEVIAGGGVRGADDLRRLSACNVKTVLAASALHDGLLTPNDWLGL
jgi:phosphoribosylformimino-5-aminoimidazole carboxamide ribotide isomerase